MNVFQAVGAVLLTVFTFGCASLQSPGNSAVEAKIRAVQEKFAPDRHLAVFKVEAEQRGERLVLRGETDKPEAKAELLQTLAGSATVLDDQITVLPDQALLGKTAGISVVSAATVREDTAPSAELGTQVLLGHSFKILKTKGFWSYIQTKDGYLGWIEKDQFIPCTPETANAWNQSSRVIVTNFADYVWKDATRTLPVCDVVPGCVLKKTGEDGVLTKVELADGRSGVIVTSSVMDFQQWKQTRNATPESIERTAKSLLGTPYLWGGTSTKMLDCSGFTKTVYFLNGIELLRNASHQFREGTPIEPGESQQNLRKGDLLFFGHKRDGKPKVTHVGIYLGDRLFIHSSGLVHINSLDPKSELADPNRIRTFLGARRMLN
jgi:cell wall-associated NlpC family hydrolase